LEHPGTVLLYNFLVYDKSPPQHAQPIAVRTVKRIEHFWDVIHEENGARARRGQSPLTDAEIAALFPEKDWEHFSDRFIESREYSDGFGRLLQTRTQAKTLFLRWDLWRRRLISQSERWGRKQFCWREKFRCSKTKCCRQWLAGL